jgi:heme/copper-type cytochrome/quinol oxidase subunit 3
MSSAAGALPRATRVPDAVIGMALFVATEAMLFAGLVSAYLVLRSQAGVWPPPGQPRLPIALTAVSTLLLLASGAAAWRACAAWRERGKSAAIEKLRLAAALGAGFLAIQGYEWARLLHYGLATSSVYAGTFYATVGVHALHVVVALVLLLWGIGALARGALGHAGLRALRIYWLFVVAVWPILYLAVYLW